MPLGLFNRGVITTMKVIAGFVTIRLRWLLNTEKTVTHCLLFILNQSICITYFCTGRYSQSHHKFTNRYFIYWPIKSLTTNHLTLKMASAQVAEKSVTKDSPSQEFNHPDDQILKVIYYCIKVGGGYEAPSSPSFIKGIKFRIWRFDLMVSAPILQMQNGDYLLNWISCLPARTHEQAKCTMSISRW